MCTDKSDSVAPVILTVLCSLLEQFGLGFT